MAGKEVQDHRRIAVAVTSSASAIAALRWALRRASHKDARVEVVHVFDESDRADLAIERDMAQAAREASQLTLERTVAELADVDNDVVVRIVSKHGSLLIELTKMAADADLLVVGLPQGDAHQGLPKALASSCNCPVVTVSAEGEAVSDARSPMAAML
jgi:nucleotide-binding universal stress UspA family protein